jgi:plastocyanin
MNDWWKVAIAAPVALLCATVLVFADAPEQTIVQSGRAFHPGEIAIKTGDTLAFSNQDEFIHQIYVKSDVFNFDSEEQAPGEVVRIAFTTAGTFEVHCHIHPKMALTVTVK